jgi:hypothetical protein
MDAIETEYGGRNFRSRTEARWAIFFEKSSIGFVYEPEGFKLDDVWYVPDFWLPDFKMYFEVKGKAANAAEIEKARQLARFSGKAVLIAEGSPGAHDQNLIWLDAAGAYKTSGFEGADVNYWVGARFLIASDRRDKDVFWLMHVDKGGGLDAFIVAGEEHYTDHDRSATPEYGQTGKGYEAASTHRFDWAKKP